jgi:hypothetical protein
VSRGRINHPIALVVVLALAAFTGAVAIASIWANDQLLSTGSWVSASNRMLKNHDVRHRVATFLGEELTDDTEAQLNSAGQGAVAEEVVPRLRAEQTQLAERVMKTKQFEAIWATANRAAHRDLLRVLEGEGDAFERGLVVVDLTPALRQIAEVLESEGFGAEFGLTDLVDQVEPGAARIRVLGAAETERAQDVVRAIRHLTAPAVIVTLVLYALALLIGWRRLSPTLIGIGLALAATGGLALLARALAGHAIVDDLLGGVGADRDAADAAWNIATSKIADLAGIAIGLGAVIVLLVAAVAIFRKAAEQRSVPA